MPAARIPTRALALVVAATAALALLLTYAWAVLTESGQVRDTAAMRAVADRAPDRQWAVELLRLVSPDTVLWAAAGLTALAALARGGRTALAVAATALGSALAAQVLKEVLTRPPLVAGSPGNSLPSGHVAAVAGLALAAVLAVPRALREVAAATGLAAVALTGLAAVTLQWHRPSDVLASALLAAAVGGLAVFVTGGGAPGGGRLAARYPAGAVRTARAE